MKTFAFLALVVAATAWAADPKGAIPNPHIDMPGHIKMTQEAAKHRETHRLSEADFLKASKEPKTLVLDA